MPEQEPIFRMPGSLVQEIINLIGNAPLGCGMSAAANMMFRQRILDTAETPEASAEDDDDD